MYMRLCRSCQWFQANLDIHFPSMTKNNDSVCIIHGKALCCHCCHLKIAWKQQSIWHKFSAVPHAFLISLPTLLNAVDLVGIVQKVGWWSSRFQERNKRAAGASLCLASTMQQVVQDLFYMWAGRFKWCWVMFLSNEQSWPKNTKTFEFFITPLQP
jgi:hypothetical protein